MPRLRHWKWVDYMLEYLNSWPVTVIGALALGILGNLLTAPVASLVAHFSQRRRHKTIQNQIDLYKHLRRLQSEGKLIFYAIEKQYTSLFFFLMTAIFLIFQASFHIISMYSAVLAGNDESQMAMSIQNTRTVTTVISIAFVLCSSFAVYVGINSVIILRKILNYALWPDYFYSHTLKNIRKLDPDFDPSRLLSD